MAPRCSRLPQRDDQVLQLGNLWGYPGNIWKPQVFQLGGYVSMNNFNYHVLPRFPFMFYPPIVGQEKSRYPMVMAFTKFALTIEMWT